MIFQISVPDQERKGFSVRTLPPFKPELRRKKRVFTGENLQIYIAASTEVASSLELCEQEVRCRGKHDNN